MANLPNKQQVFLQKYEGLLKEVDDAAKYTGECYIQEDEDIGDRLLASVSTGLIPYNPENLTLLSIFSEDEEAMERLTQFYEAVVTASKITEAVDSTEDRMRFLHETFIPRLHHWRLTVKKYG